MKKLNKRLQTIVLGIGVISIFIGIGAVFWSTLFPVDPEQERIAERVKEIQKMRMEDYPKEKHLQSPNE